MLLVNPEVNAAKATFAQKCLGALNRLGAPGFHLELYFCRDGPLLYLLLTLVIISAQVLEI